MRANRLPLQRPGARPSSTGQVQDRTTNQTLPVQTFASLRPPLAALPAWVVNQANVRRTQFRESGAERDAGVRAGPGHRPTRPATPSSASGELDALRYGDLLQPRGLVGVRGAGYSHDGFWYVKRVTHTSPRGRTQQQFTLTREGTRLDDAGGDAMSQFFGKYRGKVANNIDPMKLGRVQVSVPGRPGRRAA